MDDTTDNQPAPDEFVLGELLSLTILPHPEEFWADDKIIDAVAQCHAAEFGALETLELLLESHVAQANFAAAVVATQFRLNLSKYSGILKCCGFPKSQRRFLLGGYEVAPPD
jgi:hypothetical protein